jgi:hypothetical protein
MSGVNLTAWVLAYEHPNAPPPPALRMACDHSSFVTCLAAASKSD